MRHLRTGEATQSDAGGDARSSHFKAMSQQTTDAAAVAPIQQLQSAAEETEAAQHICPNFPKTNELLNVDVELWEPQKLQEKYHHYFPSIN